MSTRSKPALPYPILCLVTDATYAQRERLATLAARAIAGGVNMVQLRGKELPGGELFLLAKQMREVTLGRALFLVNERVDVAMATGADGVELGEAAMSVEAARALSGDRLLIGRSVHSREGAEEAEAQGADFLVVGTIFSTASKSGVAPAGPELLSRIAKTVTLPFLAIGGVNRENVAQAMEQGCSGVAVISAILGAEDPRQASQELKEGMLPITPGSTSHRLQANKVGNRAPGTGLMPAEPEGKKRAMGSPGILPLTVNGKPRELKEPMPLKRFLKEHDVASQFVAVAYNGTVLRREEFDRVILKEGDVVEIVRPVGGG